MNYLFIFQLINTSNKTIAAMLLLNKSTFSKYNVFIASNKITPTVTKMNPFLFE